MRNIPRLARLIAAGIAAGIAAVSVAIVSCSPSPNQAYTAPLPIPFNVSDYFSPTGYEGDGANAEDPTLVTMLNSACPDRSPEPLGDCYAITYNQGAADAVQGYAGVLWQYPGNNFGEYPGHDVSPGATVVTFYARGASGGEKVKFQVGGIDDPTLPFHDTVNVTSLAKTLTTDWQLYEIGLPSSYHQVLCGFGWVVQAEMPGASAAAPVVFYIDGIQWQASAPQ